MSRQGISKEHRILQIIDTRIRILALNGGSLGLLPRLLHVLYVGIDIPTLEALRVFPNTEIDGELKYLKS